MNLDPMSYLPAICYKLVNYVNYRQHSAVGFHRFPSARAGYFPVRAKHSGDKLSIFITGYFPNASPLLRPYFAPTSHLRLLTPSP
ncbi:hypothetical protein [Sphaerospermopsis torques-reginae]|uniref:Transposase n=1 Tax=Sphaerospermopsis torques-reginae ITEP-024 TaxID=984208 RepID=A0ABX8WYR5_9CYAN|nr:hypothetical protein [Sphaerospermopsis torques-reginae]QYX31543.1 hypothetical protein K2F26_22540 [Sphaerospermopsis torques-reginae ITEP-024]